jgi:hypothetical protein
VTREKITTEFLRELPKTDLHVHLDGSIRVSTLIDLAHEYHVTLPSYTEGGLRETVFKDRYQNLAEYLQGFAYTVAVLQSEPALERCAYELAQEVALHNSDACEIVARALSEETRSAAAAAGMRLRNRHAVFVYKKRDSKPGLPLDFQLGDSDKIFLSDRDPSFLT